MTTMKYIKSREISAERAKKILTGIGRADEFDASLEYLIEDEAETGEEYLMAYGYSEPLAKNHSTISWR